MVVGAVRVVGGVKPRLTMDRQSCSCDGRRGTDGVTCQEEVRPDTPILHGVGICIQGTNYSPMSTQVSMFPVLRFCREKSDIECHIFADEDKKERETEIF